ncbi:MAG: 6-pyruvoyl-tetrahydropterin synthase-related protein [Polaromonas sp.]|uniref:6-pyruvoyl-tetrahydropterin synthase-related protein n=1 Tax=Polaromonas sp. TaxID=1869339 RepID=UPI002735E7A5|nr:6-pyruvoyl-tetrahydropterin synthase-related protein [Polaromonas sp.]MDP2819594.1 6-pyruvoyl-tetrahydropterin synthase-related protein [Polaromonas sp.]
MKNTLIRAIAQRISLGGEVALTLGAAVLVASVLGISFLNSDNWPTGGDSASHLLYAWLYADSLLFTGYVMPWVPEVFGGLAFLSYYFPLPFIVIAVLSEFLGFAPAFKWGAFGAALLLPGAVYIASRRWLNFSWLPAFFGALGSLAFLLHEQSAIWGGNLLSTLAGEFSYSYGLLFAVLAMMAWARAISLGRGWVLAGLLEAACGFSHGFPLLVVGFSTIFLLLDCGSWVSFRRVFGQLARGHLLAFGLLGGWLWPLLEMHGLTIPNDASFPLSGWRDLLPATLWPSIVAGVTGLALLAVPAVRRSWRQEQALALRYLTSGAGLAAFAFIVGDKLGLADIRFFPMVWLFGGLVCGWLFGQALAVLGAAPGRVGNGLLRLARAMIVSAFGLGLLGWLGQHVHQAPGWAQWNHSGLDAKPQWHNLSQLFPAMRGDLWSPRLLFEHDPANEDIGSTRTLESLPMFLNHRPVLEGLYMESAVLGPAIYQLQSEVSARASSPLVRFPTGPTIDPSFAAKHMNFMHTDTLLLRSTQAKAAIEASALFEKIAESSPFTLYRLKQFDSRLVQVVTQPLRILSEKNWMEDAFIWFRTRSRFDAYLPVYGENLVIRAATQASLPSTQVGEKLLSRHELVFETQAIGRPHLIKIAYHPRWQLLSKGSLRIAGPGFMLIVPEEREIQLVYGHTLVGKMGMVATALSVFYLMFLGLKRKQKLAALPEILSICTARARLRWLPLLTGWGILVIAGTFFAMHSPERAYNHAWELFRSDRYEAASEQFLRAYELRKPTAKREEALFWLAKSIILAGHRAEAKARYRELCEQYQGYWLPESLYILALLEREDGHSTEAESYIRRLREEYPTNTWTLKLDTTK